MATPKYVKLFKGRKIAWIVSAIGTAGCAVLVIISFLGRSLGTFTTKMKVRNSDVRLDISEKFENPTSYLSVGDLLPFTIATNSQFSDHSNIDNENTTTSDLNPQLDPEIPNESMRCFKFTFFVKNLGEKTAHYNLDFNVDDLKMPDNREDGLDDLLRVRWYENDATKPNEHKFTTYAKARRKPKDHEGNIIENEYIAGNDASQGIAEKFLYKTYVPGESKILQRKEVLLVGGQCMRYTALLWLEGNDPECYDEPPENASIRLGIDIDVMESGANSSSSSEVNSSTNENEGK